MVMWIISLVCLPLFSLFLVFFLCFVVVLGVILRYRNRKQRAPTGRKSIARRAFTSDTDRRKRLIQLVATQLTQTELGGLGGTVGEKAALFTDTLLRSAEEVMPGQIRQSRISGLLEDEAMHDEFEEAWTEREEARKAVHGTLAGGSAFRALRTACKKLRDVIQAAEDRYLEVFACELEEFIAAGDLRGWYGHLKGGWKLQGKKLRGTQYIRDEKGKLLRKPDEIRARWRRYFTSLLNTTPQSNNYRGPTAKADSPVTRRSAGCE